MGQGGRRNNFTIRSHYSTPRNSHHTIMDLNGASSSDNISYIYHNVSRLDTLAGIAIKYGVEVADIKRLNGLTTDLQMFARKTLRIPSHGRHAPSEQHLLENNGHVNPDSQPPRLGKHSFTPSYGINDEFSVGKRKVSPAMGLLRGYYGLNPPSTRGDAEGTEMDVYKTDNGTGYQSEDEPFTPRESISNSKLKPPVPQSTREESSSASSGVSTLNNMVSMARDFVVGEIEKAAFRRRPKGENSVEDKQEYFSGGAPRPRSSGSSASRFGLEVEVDCPTVRALVFNGNSGGKGKSVGGKVVEELIFKLKKSSSAPDFADEKQPLIQKMGNNKTDAAVLNSSGPPAANGAGNIPLLDSLTRRSKTAVD